MRDWRNGLHLLLILALVLFPVACIESDGSDGAQGVQGPAGPVAGINGQVIYNDNDAAAGANMYYDNSTGSVGIGTPVPDAMLDVAGDANIDLPTDDNTSSFAVNKNDSSPVLTVQGNGNVGIRKDTPATALDVDGVVTALQFEGDGSRLTNVKPLASYSQSNSYYTLTGVSSGGAYEVVKSVSLAVPSGGLILVTATGYAKWEGINNDFLRCGILQNAWGNPNNTLLAESRLYDNLMLASDYNSADQSNVYASFTTQRGFTINTAGTYTFHLWADSYMHEYTSERHVLPISAPITADRIRTSVADVNLFAIYFPTGGVAVPNP